MINYEQTIQSAAASLGAGTPMEVLRRATPVVYVTGAGIISSGTVKVEESPTGSYAGTWSELSSIDASELTGGAVRAVHLVEGVYGHIRTRISSAIVGGGNITSLGRFTE